MKLQVFYALTLLLMPGVSGRLRRTANYQSWNDSVPITVSQFNAKDRLDLLLPGEQYATQCSFAGDISDSMDCHMEDFPFSGLDALFQDCDASSDSVLECKQCAIYYKSSSTATTRTEEEVKCKSCTVCDNSIAWDCSNTGLALCPVSTCDGCTCSNLPDNDCHDSSAWSFICQWFNQKPELCDTQGDAYGSGHFTAKDACCVCGGGLHYGLQPSCNIMDPEKFNICLDLGSRSGQYESWMESVAKAKVLFERIIVGDVGEPLSSSGLAHKAGDIQFVSTQYPDLIDDLYVAATDTEIDGVSGILAVGRWWYHRMSDRMNPRTGEPYVLALTGQMKYDAADIDRLMADNDKFDNLVAHEMGHILGFGSLWGANGLYSSDRSGVYADNTNAAREWNALGCTGPLPIEQEGGVGRADVHWSEECLGHELMTGDVSGLDQPLSRVTIGAFEDLGYEQVDYSQADVFTRADLGSCGSSCPGPRRLRSRMNEARILSEASQQAILQYAKTEFDALALQDLPFLDLPGQGLDVFYQEEDGRIFVVQVMSED